MLAIEKMEMAKDNRLRWNKRMAKKFRAYVGRK